MFVERNFSGIFAEKILSWSKNETVVITEPKIKRYRVSGTSVVYFILPIYVWNASNNRAKYSNGLIHLFLELEDYSGDEGSSEQFSRVSFIGTFANVPGPSSVKVTF